MPEIGINSFTQNSVIHSPLERGGVILPNMGMVGRFHRYDPHIFRFSIRLGTYVMTHHDLTDPLTAEKNRFVSNTLSSRDTET